MKVRYEDRFVDERCLLVTCDLETSKVSTSVVNKPMFEFELDMYQAEQLRIYKHDSMIVEHERLSAWALEYEIYLTYDLLSKDTRICEVGDVVTGDIDIDDKTVALVQDEMLYQLGQMMIANNIESDLLEIVINNW